MNRLHGLTKSFINQTANVDSKMIVLDILEWLRENDFERQANSFESSVKLIFEDFELSMKSELEQMYSMLREKKYDPVLSFIEEKKSYVLYEIDRSNKKSAALDDEVETRYDRGRYDGLIYTLSLLETMKQYVRGM